VYPTGARSFGDLGDENSAVSKLVAEREGYDLMPEMGYKPTNKYLAPRKRRDTAIAGREVLPKGDGSAMDRLFAWADKLMTGERVTAAINPTDASDRLEG
jgi:sulfite dehydrogenase (quinone) subunit SoeB